MCRLTESQRDRQRRRDRGSGAKRELNISKRTLKLKALEAKKRSWVVQHNNVVCTLTCSYRMPMIVFTRHASSGRHGSKHSRSLVTKSNREEDERGKPLGRVCLQSCAY